MTLIITRFPRCLDVWEILCSRATERKERKRFSLKQLFSTRITLRFIITYGLVFGFLCGQVAFAKRQETPKPLQNIPLMTKAPKIDGVLDNPIWETQALKEI